MLNLKKSLQISGALFRAAFCIALLFNFAYVGGAQTKSRTAAGQKFVTAPPATVTLTDSFADQNGDAKAQPGEEVTYTATIINNSGVAMPNVILMAPGDPNAAVVENSMQVKHDSLSPFALRCRFNTENGGSGDCEFPSSAYGSTNANNDTVIGGQNSRLKLAATNISYDPQTGAFSFKATVQNLLAQSLGTIDGETLDSAGVQLFLNNLIVTSGAGGVSFASADGLAQFTAPDQPYFQFNEILGQNQISSEKTLQLNVPETVKSFTVDFLVSTKVAAKLVINEVMVNPGGVVSDAEGEWFELYNAGLFPINLQGFKINDLAPVNEIDCSAFPCENPSHTIASSVTIQPDDYLVLGNTTDTTNNGGAPVDYGYGAVLSFADSQDGIRVQSPHDVTLEQAIYQNAAISAQNGISRELKDATFDNLDMDDQSIWQDASADKIFGLGGRGTPGADNSTAVIQPVPNSSVLCLASQPKINSVNNVLANVGTLEPGQTAVITYRVKVADPLPVGITQISSQATITDDFCTTVISDDPGSDSFADATITPLETAAAPQSYSISGTVMYGNTPVNDPVRYVPDVVMNLNGAALFLSSPDPVQSSQMGDYQINNLTPGGEYTVTPSKSGNADGITAFDATLILRCVAAGVNCDLTANQQLAADTDADSSVSSFDAAQILRFVAASAQTPNTGQTGNWRFTPASVTYKSLNSDVSNQNYTALLIGEVDGDWSAASVIPDVANKGETAFAEVKSLSQPEQIRLSMPANSEAITGGSVKIPVYLMTAANTPISAYSFAVRFDPNILQPEFKAAEIADDLNNGNLAIAYDTNTPGRIGIAASAPNGFVSSSGTVLYLRFKVVSKVDGSTAISFETTKRSGIRFEDERGNKIFSTASNGSLSIVNSPSEIK